MNDKYNYETKRAVIEQFDKPNIKSFFEKYENTYFPDDSRMSPMDKFDNVLEQLFNLKQSMIAYSMGVEKYSEVIREVLAEFYTFVNRAEELKEKSMVSEKKDMSECFKNLRTGQLEEAAEVIKDSEKTQDITQENQKE